jgi:hypothetical protein
MRTLKLQRNLAVVIGKPSVAVNPILALPSNRSVVNDQGNLPCLSQR